MYWVLVLISVASSSMPAITPLPQHFQNETACEAVRKQWIAGSGSMPRRDGACLLMPREEGGQ